MKNLFVDYNTFKSARNSEACYYIAQAIGYEVYAHIKGFFTKTTITSNDDISDFETLLKPSSISVASGDDALLLASPQLPPVTADNKPIVASEKPDSAKTTIISHDWTDKTTWYSNSVRVADEILSNSGNNIKYTFANTYIIDTYHGKLSQEDFLVSNDGYSYRVEVHVNDIIKLERDPHFGTGGDYTINYEDGYVEFISELLITDIVTATYHYATDSVFIIAPMFGKQLKIDRVEVQFSQDVVLTDAVVFQAYGYVDVFAPQLVPSVIPSGTKIPLGPPLIYKGMKDFMNDASRSYPPYQNLSPNTWRGIDFPIVIFDWDYTASTALRYDYGMEIHVSLQHDTEFLGSFATASIYCRSESL